MKYDYLAVYLVRKGAEDRLENLVVESENAAFSLKLYRDLVPFLGDHHAVHPSGIVLINIIALGSKET